MWNTFYLLLNINNAVLCLIETFGSSTADDNFQIQYQD